VITAIPEKTAFYRQGRQEIQKQGEKLGASRDQSCSVLYSTRHLTERAGFPVFRERKAGA
jgi:predicted transposase YdaD